MRIALDRPQTQFGTVAGEASRLLAGLGRMARMSHSNGHLLQDVGLEAHRDALPGREAQLLRQWF